MNRGAPLITFYSYKGGVGRTQAVANVAVALANQEKDVVMVDMDLESPGLHAYFSRGGDLDRPMKDADLADTPGVADFLERAARRPDEEPRVDTYLLECHHRSLVGGRVRLLPAGKIDASYAKRIAEFSWDRFYDEQRGYQYMELMRQQLVERTGADLVLLDSRTGVTDVGMVCTFQLPDVVLLLFALHRQGIHGTQRIARAIDEQRKLDPDARAREMLFVPTRVDEGEKLDGWLEEARDALGPCGGELLSEVHHRIPYWSPAALGEQVVIATEGAGNILCRAYERLATRLLALGTGRSEPEEARDRLPEVEPSVGALANLADEMRAGTADLEKLTAGRDLAQLDLSRIVTWAHQLSLGQLELADGHARLMDGLRRFNGRAAEVSRQGQVGGGRHQDPTTIAAWRERLGELRAELDTARARVDEKRREVMKRVSAAAHDDPAAERQALSELEPLLCSGRWQDLDLRLAAKVEELEEQSVSKLIKRNELDPDRLARRFPERADQVRWIEAQLTGLLEESGPTDAAGTARALNNLLRLRIGDLNRPELTHWTAYDTLCLLVREDPEADREAFAQVGQRLWTLSWQQLLAGERSDLDTPAGRETRDQLERLDREPDRSLSGLTREVSRGLSKVLSAAAPSRPVDVEALFRRRADDPCLRGAVAGLVQEPTAPLSQVRKAAGLWFQTTAETTPHILVPLLERLADNGWPAEAFYGLCACVQKAPTVLEDAAHDHRIYLISFIFLDELVGRGEWLALRDLLLDDDLGQRILGRRPGMALAAAVAGGLVRPALTIKNPVPDLAPRLRTQVLQAPPTAGPLPTAVRSWLECDNLPDDTDIATADRVRRAQEDLEEINAGSLYGGWARGDRYREELQRLIDEEFQRLLDDTAPRSDVDVRLGRLDAKAWIRDTHRQVKDKYGGDPPKGTGRTELVKRFDRLKETLIDLNAVRPVQGHPTLRQSEARVERQRQVRAELLEWLRPAEGKPDSLTRRVIARIGG